MDEPAMTVVFNEMARLLMSWPTVPTLDIWAATPAPKSRKWDGRKRTISAEVDERPVMTWGQMRERIDSMKGASL